MTDKKFIFRIYEGGSAANSDWHGSSQFPYDDSALDSIQVGNGDKFTDEITSIPSPFARIDIAKNAFHEVVKRGLDGNSIFHKTVSDILDVGEIFFNYDKLKDLVEIIKWSPNNIQGLKSSTNDGNKFLGESLFNYLKSDGPTYNFGSNQDIYILRYRKGKSSMEVIGATSPATLFFSSANDLSHISKIISFGKDHPFDKDFCPLYKRGDFNYIKAWFIMRNRIANFSTLMPEVDEYLDKTAEAIEDDTKRQELLDQGLTADQDTYADITTTVNGSSNTVEVLGNNLLMKVIKPVTNSDFMIRPTKKGCTPILVLPVEPGNIYANFKYTQETYGKEAHAPYKCDSPLGSRTLPDDGRKQDYLTISDFLEDTIIKVPHKFNNDGYYNPMTFTPQGNPEEYSFLIPLKEIFFKYFSANDLMNNTPNTPSLSIDELASGSVNVTLRIPVKGHGSTKVVTYERRYSGDSDIKNNKGGIEEFDFAAFVMPLAKDSNEEKSIYTIGCVNTTSRNYTLKFFKNDISIPASKFCRNQNSRVEYKQDVYTLTKSYFEYIQVANLDGIKGLIIPKFRENIQSNKFRFSIDVGTSNTHVAFVKNGSNKIEDFHYDKSDSLLCPVFITTSQVVTGTVYQVGLVQEENIVLRDILPNLLGEESGYKFPTRTVLSCAKIYKTINACPPFSLYNASLSYDKVTNNAYNDDKSNIKWGVDNVYLRDYISCILLMIRNKVILDDGDLNSTEVTWFFPTSMPMKRKNDLMDIWSKLYDEYIGGPGTSYMTESSAPIYYIFDTETVANDIISIDIGGGTTDIAFAQQKKINAVSSFRFASNTLFENQLAPGDLSNSIVDYYKNYIKDKIRESNSEIMDGEMEALFESDSHSEPANMASFLFSLQNIEGLSSLSEDVIGFNHLLNRDENYKIVFILFYTAILYHIGKIIKYKDFDLPDVLSFSGNGSKILKVISTNVSDLASFSQKVLQIVSGKEYDGRMSIVGLGKDDNPKTMTCKGGLKVNTSSLKSDPQISMKADGNGEIKEETTLESIKLDEGYQNMVIDSVQEFLNLALNVIPKEYKYNYDEHFGVNSDALSIARSMIKERKQLGIFLSKGIDLLIQEYGEKEYVTQTMFFLPLKGYLNELSNRISQQL